MANLPNISVNDHQINKSVDPKWSSVIVLTMVLSFVWTRALSEATTAVRQSIKIWTKCELIMWRRWIHRWCSQNDLEFVLSVPNKILNTLRWVFEKCSENTTNFVSPHMTKCYETHSRSSCNSFDDLSLAIDNTWHMSNAKTIV